MTDTKEMLQRARERVAPPEDLIGSLTRRRQKTERARRISTIAVAILVAVLGLAGIIDAFRGARSPAGDATPSGISSPIGGWLTYGNAVGIWAIDPSKPDDPNARIMLSTTPGTTLGWSGDGSELLFERDHLPGKPADDHALVVLHADGTETPVAMTTGLPFFGATISPDGSRVVYATWDQNNRSSIWVVDVSGGPPRLLVDDAPRYFPALERKARPLLYDPVFSPDGMKIAYFNGMGDHSHSLMVMDSDGSDQRRLLFDLSRDGSHASNLVWSPDGRRLAFALVEEGIYLVDSDGSNLTMVIPNGTNPYWSPDGTRISYDIVDQPSGQLVDLEIAAPDGTRVERLPAGRSGPWNPGVHGA